MAPIGTTCAETPATFKISRREPFLGVPGELVGVSPNSVQGAMNIKKENQEVFERGKDGETTVGAAHRTMALANEPMPIRQKPLLNPPSQLPDSPRSQPVKSSTP